MVLLQENRPGIYLINSGRDSRVAYLSNRLAKYYSPIFWCVNFFSIGTNVVGNGLDGTAGFPFVNQEADRNRGRISD